MYRWLSTGADLESAGTDGTAWTDQESPKRIETNEDLSCMNFIINQGWCEDEGTVS
jgi:hypothetical protein